MDYPISYIPDNEYVSFIKSIPQSRKELVSIDEKMRWLITLEDGSKNVIRPESTKPV